MAIKTKISRQDLKIYPSERLSDNDDGGGMPLGTPLAGTANELFKPISSIARINGGFYARLEYAGVLRADNAPLIGSFMAITKPPKDDTVSYLLCKANFGELRRDMLKRIEGYNVAGIESRVTLLSDQPANSKVIQAYQTVGEPLPMVGDVYCLRQNKAGYPYAEQYIQVTRVTAEDREFTDQSGKKFKKTVLKLELSSKLNTDFIGVDYPVESYGNSPCKVRETNVADAAQYYGVKPLSRAIEKEVTKIQLTSLMEKIVPTNQISTKLLDLTAAGQRQTLFDGSKTGNDGIVTLNVAKNHTAGQITSLYFGNAVTPSSVIIDSNVGVITDKGGTLYRDTVAVGSMDYAKGLGLISEPTFVGYINTLKFRPASSELKVADTMRINVDINNRSDSYTFNIFPPPAVGTLQVSYRAQGRWIDLKDDGAGVLRGASVQHGSGSINFSTGSGSISTGELPDVGSAILLSWGTKANYFNRSNTTATAKLLLRLSQDADPSSLVLSWDNNGAKTARSDITGKITGDWTGIYDKTTHGILIDTGTNFNHPAGVLSVKATYNKGVKQGLVFDGLIKDAGGNYTLDLGGVAIMPNTFSVNWQAGSSTITAKDDGAGKIVNEKAEQIGTIDYTAHRAVFKADSVAMVATAVFKVSRSSFLGAFKKTRSVMTGYTYNPVTVLATGTATASFYENNPQNQVIDNLKSDTLVVDLLPTFDEVVTPSSVNFSFGNKVYFDKMGQIFTDLDTKTGSAVTAGVMDYLTGLATLKNWQWTDGQAPFVKSLVTSISGNLVDAVTFRTPQSPIKAGSLDIRATADDGTLLRARATYNGELKASNIEGKVDAEYGMTDVFFGAWVAVTDAMRAESWFTEDMVVAGKIWQPKHVFADTITYNADAYTYLPVDTSIVKIDTVRLPQDGRVPIFRRGDSILISNRIEQNIGSAFTGGSTVQLSRKDVDRICINDSDGKPVNAELWDYDLDAGTITWKTALDLSPYKLPLTAVHTQEERNRVLEVDIDGTLTLIFATKRAYVTEGTYVSSLLIGGNLEVRISVPFTQRNWNEVWQDTPNGAQLLNKLNITDYPVVLTDDGAITAKWLIKWTSSTQFELYSDNLGFVGRFDTLTNLAPLNPATSKPYFTIDKRSFGNQSPWGAQDVIRFNTWGTLLPVAVLCAVQPSSVVPKGEDGFTQCLFGDTTEII